MGQFRAERYTAMEKELDGRDISRPILPPSLPPSRARRPPSLPPGSQASSPPVSRAGSEKKLPPVNGVSSRSNSPNSRPSSRAGSAAGESKQVASPPQGRSPQQSPVPSARFSSATRAEQNNSEGEMDRRRGSLQSRDSATSDGRRELRRKVSAGSTRLSFIMDFTLNHVGHAILTEDPSWNFNTIFWHALLVGEPHAGFKPLQNRTLAFWVGCFNKWQAMRTSEGLAESINALQLQEMVFLSKGNLVGVVKLFDRAGGRRVVLEGQTISVLSSIQIPMVELLAAGVLLSRLISTNHKLRFLLSLVDTRDNGWVDESQFASFLKCVTHGLGAVFNAPAETVPSKADTNTVAQRLHSRICKLIRKSSKSSLPSIDQSVDKGRNATTRLSHQALHDWCFGSLSEEDPLALPYRLTLERFCPTRHGDIADEFDDRLANFSLSYSCPVTLPEDAEIVSRHNLLERAEVLLARDIFEHGKSLGRIRLEENELKELLKKTGRREISRMMQLTFLNALEAIVEQHCRPGGGVDHIDFFDYLRQLCPKAQPKHIRMFDVWCTEYDRHMEMRDNFADIEQAARTFIANDKKPVLPPDEISRLGNEFARLDQEGNGFLTMDDIMKGWGWSAQTALETIEAYDILGDSYIDKDAFLRMMCPVDFKLPAMSGFAREAFGKVLLDHVESTKTAMRTMDSSYELKDSAWGSESSQGPTLRLPPPSALPEVPQESLEQWNNVFDELDQDEDNKVTVKDLEASGLLSTVVCYCIASLIDPEDSHGFTRAGFVTAMCKAHGYRQKLLAS